MPALPRGGHAFDPSILREYDVRGIYGATLCEADAYALGRSFATVVQRHRDEPVSAAGAGPTSPPAPMPRPRIVVGRDGRLSSADLEEALVTGLREGGVDVVQVGLGPSPMVYFAEASLEEVVGAVQVTGSHNPPDHNGFKIVLGGRPFFGAALVELGAIARAGAWTGLADRQFVPDEAGIVPAASPPEALSDEGERGDVLACARGLARVEGFAKADRLARGRDGVRGGDPSGGVERCDVSESYTRALLGALAEADPDALARLRIGWDAGNGAAGPLVEKLCAVLPGCHHVLFSDVDGRFPNHHPDPTILANLADLRALVAAKNLDFGVAFDGDGDRIGVVDGQGRVLWGDQLTALFARDILAHDQWVGRAVVGDVKMSQTTFEVISRSGGIPVMAPSGHSHIKSKMKETGAVLGGEMSGHLFFADHYLGFDDGLYAAVRLMALVARSGQTVAGLLDGLPRTCATPELRFEVPAGRSRAVVEEVAGRLREASREVVTIDGLRVTSPDGWWLLRASNTQDMLTARAESASPEGLARLVAEIDAQLALSGLARPAD